jgi:acyl transferase domain-containing protein
MDNIFLDLESAAQDTCWEGAPEIITISDGSRDDIEKTLRGFAKKFAIAPIEEQLPKLAAESRASFSSTHACRLSWIITTPDEWLRDIDEVINQLKQNTAPWWNLKNIFYGEITRPSKLSFVFPGQGSQYIHMGRDLVRCFLQARQCLAHADACFDQTRKLTDLIYPSTDAGTEPAMLEEALRSTDAAQIAIGAVSLAMMKILQRFGIQPDAACGHSYGELTALHAGGRLDEETFLRLSVARGKYMADAGSAEEKGGMLAVKAPLEKIYDLINASNLDLVLANRNSPDQGVLSGPVDAIAKMKSICREHKIISAILPVSGAFHSRLVASAAAPFEQEIKAAGFFPPLAPVYSNTTALPYPDIEESAKKLLSGHLMNPVNFVDEIGNMHQAGVRIFIEVGPRTVLTGLIKSILKNQDIFAMGVDGSSGKQSGMLDLAKILCMLASIGWPVNLKNWKSA